MSEKIILKGVRLSYEHIFNASSIAGSDPKYSATFIIPKSDKKTIAEVKTAILTAGDAAFPGKITAGKWPSSLHNPLKDGDELADEHPEYAGSYILRAGSKSRPVVLDRRKAAVSADDGLIYSGCYVNASLAAAGFDAQAKKGVTCYLNGVQFVRDGERLSGYDATADFDEIDDEDDLDDEDMPF